MEPKESDKEEGLEKELTYVTREIGQGNVPISVRVVVGPEYMRHYTERVFHSTIGSIVTVQVRAGINEILVSSSVPTSIRVLTRNVETFKKDLLAQYKRCLKLERASTNKNKNKKTKENKA